MNTVDPVDLRHFVERAASVILGRPVSDRTALGAHHRIIGELANRLCGHKHGLPTKSSTTVGNLKEMIPRPKIVALPGVIGVLGALRRRVEDQRQDYEISLALAAVELSDRIPRGFSRRYRDDALLNLMEWLDYIMKFGGREEKFREPLEYRWRNSEAIIKAMNGLKKAWAGILDVAVRQRGEDGVYVRFRIPGST